MNFLKSVFFFSFLVILFTGCGDDEDNPDAITPTVNTAGLTVKNSTSNIDAAYDSVRAQILAKGFNIVAEVNHQEAASGVNLELDPTRVIIFGNPEGGTKLMQADQRIGIDLPLKMLIRENDGAIEIAYYNASTLKARYNIDGLDELENNVNTALDEISGGQTISTPGSLDNDVNSLFIRQSDRSARATFDSLEAVLVANDFNIVAKVEHDMAAAGVGLELRPTKVIIFGKPQVGTQLMQSNNQIGIDLPQKMLVWEDEDGSVLVGYYSASFITSRHGINDRENVVDMVNIALNDLVTAALN